ncbi:MAG: FAD-dependent monooxygenase [Promethearchaeota archaeon]
MSQQSVDYDVTIVGGGPGGSTAGYLLKRLGLNVQIIDKDIFPRQKLCGGILTFKTFKLLKRVFGETVESLLDKHIIDYFTNRFEINYKVKRVMSSNISQFPFYFVDRLVYDNFL